MSPRPHDEGSGTVAVLGIVAVLATCCLMAAALFQGAAARHRAESAADLAALAAAQAVIDGRTSGSCSAAEGLASRNGAVLTSCVVRGEEAWVTTAVNVRGVLAGLGPATARAHAGPGGPAG